MHPSEIAQLGMFLAGRGVGAELQRSVAPPPRPAPMPATAAREIVAASLAGGMIAASGKADSAVEAGAVFWDVMSLLVTV